MSGIARPAALEALNTSLSKAFQEAMQTPIFSETAGMCTTIPSTTEFNTYGWLASMGGMREWLGARIVEGMKERRFTIYNKKYEKTVGVGVDELDDGSVATAQFAMASIATAARVLQEDLLLAVLEGGAAATVAGTCYDGQYFFDTDHPTDLDGTGTQRNYYSTGLALDATNLKAAIAAMQSFKGENGRPLGVGQRGLTLLVAPGSWGAAIDAAEAKTISTGGENILASKYNVKPVQWARLTSATRWFLLDLSSPGPAPFIWQPRLAPQFVSKTSPSDDNVFERDEYLWGAKARAGMGYGMWFKAFSADT